MNINIYVKIIISIIAIIVHSNAYAITIVEKLEKAQANFLEICRVVEKNNVYDCGCLSKLYVDLPVHKKKVISSTLFMDQTELASYRNKILAEKSEKILKKLDNFCELSKREKKKEENIRKYIGYNLEIPYQQYCKLKNRINLTKNGVIKIVNPKMAMPRLIKQKAISSCVKKDFLDAVLAEEKIKCIKDSNRTLKNMSHIEGSKADYLLGYNSAESLCSCIERKHKDAILLNYANIKYSSNFNSMLDNDLLLQCATDNNATN